MRRADFFCAYNGDVSGCVRRMVAAVTSSSPLTHFWTERDVEASRYRINAPCICICVLGNITVFSCLECHFRDGRLCTYGYNPAPSITFPILEPALWAKFALRQITYGCSQTFVGLKIRACHVPECQMSWTAINLPMSCGSIRLSFKQDDTHHIGECSQSKADRCYCARTSFGNTQLSDTWLVSFWCFMF